MGGDTGRWDDLPVKLDRLAAVAAAAGAHTLVLSEPATLTWLLGCRVNVPQTLDTACLDAVLTFGNAVPRITIVTNRIEAPRLQDTELAGLEADWTVLDWWASRPAQLPTGAQVAGDREAAGRLPLAGQIAVARRQLTGRQSHLLAAVCGDTAAAATAAAAQLRPTDSEYHAAALFARELVERRLDPIVLMVAGAQRMPDHRHPLPTAAALGGRAMLVACGRRDGLVASVTRIVSFTPVSAGDRRRYLDLLHVEQAFLDATAVGATLGDIVTAGTVAYAANGFDPNEWHRHHQGGFSGFQPREFPAHPGSEATVPDSAVLAWNPSGAGWKVEDTTLVDAAGVHPLVHDDRWPTVQVGGRPRPDLLEI